MTNQPNDKYKWNLSTLLSDESDENFNNQLKIIEEENYKFINKWKNNTEYLEIVEVLKQALDEYDKLDTDIGASGNVGYYNSLKGALDQSNPEIKARMNKVRDLAVKITNDMEFFTHKLAKIPEQTQRLFLADVNLGPYKHFLEQLFNEAKYLLTEPEEKIINLTSGTSYSSWVRMTSDFLSREERKVFDRDGKESTKTFAEISDLLSDKTKTVRDKSAEAFNDILSKHVDTAEAEINSILQYKKVLDELRGFTRPDQSRHLADDIPTNSVDAMRQVVKQNFDIPYKFYKKKAEMLGLPKLAYHERNVEVGNISKKKYTFEEAVELVRSVFERLDPEFKDILDGFIKNGQIDVFPNKGKANGAFCAHNLKIQPTYVLLNFTGRLNDVTTLAHEMGHAINNELTRKKQNAINFGVFTSTAEVASTFFEDFVLEEIEKSLDEETKVALEMSRQNDFVSTVFRQVACYEFELGLHEEFRNKGYLSKDDIGNIFQKHMSAYMGDYVEQSPGSENWWVYWSHIRRFFYVYSYASGLLISKALQNKVRSDSGYIEMVKEFLSTGTSVAPADLFFRLGIDIKDTAFWQGAFVKP